MNKILRLCFFALLFLSCRGGLDLQERSHIDLNKNWSFLRGVEVDESKWKQVHLPHTPKIEPLVVNNQWQGVCWYKKIRTPSQLIKGKNHFLRFEGVMQEAEVWINGALAKKHVYLHILKNKNVVFLPEFKSKVKAIITYKNNNAAPYEITNMVC